MLEKPNMHSLFLPNTNATTLTSSLLFLNTNNNFSSKARFQCSIKATNPNTKQVTNSNKKVIILWDLDNKPPHGPPYNAALSLKTFAERFGDVVSISAYTKRHSFFNLPLWNPNPNPNSFLCRVCGYECRSLTDVNIHFKRVHEYQKRKTLNRLKSIKLKRSKVNFIRKVHRYNEAKSNNAPLKVGFGMASELRRGGVFVKIVTVRGKVKAADSSLKREMMSGGVDSLVLVLVSDDSVFSKMLRKVREVKVETVVVGDYWGRDLGRNADLWLPWILVENGNVEYLMGGTVEEDLDDELEEDENIYDYDDYDYDDDGFYVY
ncbi:putative transcription factor C2H2 family [Medicago truncatula]|uniref:NYN domain protein n=1 Tax=Medicago truncatula TaxID=3880 RepID=G7I2D3_MEDTR|nr:uncharacterized protein LOC11413050 [Medicago truncatula]AES59402.2 NYN domain protein [Medicago truncatula]RHN77285.1 putative transcription factor C2H2 family [Medicago truncatula]